MHGSQRPGSVVVNGDIAAQVWFIKAIFGLAA